VRDFVKKNVLKKFDEDYNFLFASSYDFFLDRSKHANFIDSVLIYYPLMQIVVPELLTITPESWNTAGHVPLVAVVPEMHRPNKDTLTGAYDAQGKLHMLSTLRDPKEHVVVISEDVRTKLYTKNNEPNFGRVKKSNAGKRCDIMLRMQTPESILSTNGISYYLKKEVSDFNNMIEEGCGGGGGGGSSSTSSCQRAALPNEGKDIIGDMSYQNFNVLKAVSDWTGSAKDFKMDIDHGGINGSAVKNFAVYFWVSRHTSSSCNFFIWCWATQFNPAVPTPSWDGTNDGDQMKYTLRALGNGTTRSASSTYTATGSNGTSPNYTVPKTITSKDKVLAEDYVKYCEQASGQGTRYGVNQLAYFYIHR